MKNYSSMYKFKIGELFSQWDYSKRFVFEKLKSVLVFVHLLPRGEYSKFIILGRSRTGSNLLKSYLNAHPEILCYGEVLRAVGSKNESFDSKNFILRKVFHNYAKGLKCVGFKLFYSHASTPKTDSIWKYLKDENVKIIHITRENILETLLSRKTSQITDQWVKKKKGNIPDLKFKLTYEECLNEFEKTRLQEDSARGFFNKDNMFEITYENLVSNQKDSLKDVFAFLGVEDFEVNTNMKKQNTKKLSDRIINYEELKSKFLNTKWKDFFRD